MSGLVEEHEESEVKKNSLGFFMGASILQVTNLVFTAIFTLDSSGCWHVCSLVQNSIFTI